MHSHLLPGVDDGVQTAEESLICLRQFAAWGVQHLVTTPHISQDRYPNTTAHLRAAAQEIQDLIRAENLPITFTVAAEYMLDELFVERLEEDDLLSFGHERYVLIETGWVSLPLTVHHWLFQLQTRGYRPVLAHPERYPYLRGKIEALHELRRQGCLFQINLMSLTNRYGADTRRAAQTLIKHRLVDFVASDLHRPHDLVLLEKARQTTDYQAICTLPLIMPTFI